MGGVAYGVMPSLRRDDAFYWRGSINGQAHDPSTAYATGRRCATCTTILSRYNPGKMCAQCERRYIVEILRAKDERNGFCERCGHPVNRETNRYCSRDCALDARAEARAHEMRERLRRAI